MNVKKWVIILLIIILVLILLSIEEKKSIHYAKIRIPIPYRMTILDKDKYHLRSDAIIYNELATVPEKFYTSDYKCEQVYKHLYCRFKSLTKNVMSEYDGIRKLHTPINTLFNNVLDIKRSVDPYATGMIDHMFFIRANPDDYREVFMTDNNVYVL